MVPARYSKERMEQLKLNTERLIIVDFQPTAENLVVHIKSIIQEVLPSYATLQKIVLFETASSSAEWHLGDN